MIEEVKKAKLLKGQGVSVKDIEMQVGISRNYIPKLLELYDEMSDVQHLDDKNSDYVRIKKKRYMMKSIKLQHRISDMRDLHLKQLLVLKNKRKVISDYLEAQEEVVDLKKEILYKQQMLDVTSSNLQHAEDGYEYIKVEWNYTKAIWFIIGVSVSLVALMILKKLGFI